MNTSWLVGINCDYWLLKDSALTWEKVAGGEKKQRAEGRGQRGRTEEEGRTETGRAAFAYI